MSVLSYLTSRASGAVLSGTEKESINKSIATLKARLTTYFDGELSEHFRFGSSSRGTILPRSMDEHSDIDYMIVFNDSQSTPQTYLDRLKRFAENYYGRSEIYQSSPTIVLELNHIKFDLVPAKSSWFSGLQIPNASGGWVETAPNDFNSELESFNSGNGNLIKPTIRLFKYWNASNGYVFDSFSFEKWIVSQSYWLECNQKDYLLATFERVGLGSSAAQWRKDKLTRARQLIANVRSYEKQGMSALAESEVKKLIPTN
jgi:hypothetical protein